MIFDPSSLRAPSSVPRPAWELHPAAPENTWRGVTEPTKLFIVLHTMEGTLDGCISWFANPEAMASSNFGVGRDGKLVCFLDPAGPDSPFANGGVRNPDANALYWLRRVSGENLNYVSVSIEHDDNGRPGVDLPTDAQIHTSSQVAAYYIQRYLMPHGSIDDLDTYTLLGHFEIDSVTRAGCPGWPRTTWQAYEQSVLTWLTAAQPVPDPCADLKQQLAAMTAARDSLSAQTKQLAAQNQILTSQNQVLVFNSTVAKLLLDNRDADAQAALDALADALRKKQLLRG